MTSIAFLGLGRMGGGMAARLVAAGHDVTVWNRTAERCGPLVAAGARSAATPAGAVRDAEAVVVMLGDDEASRAVWLGPDGVLAGSPAPGALAIECSTLSDGWVRELSLALRRNGLRYVDAPVTGLPDAAAAGTLTLLVGADEADLAAARQVLAPLAADVRHFGPVGAGTAYKLLVNLMGAVQIAGVAEGLAIAERAGLDLAQVADTIATGQAASPQVVRNARRMVAADHADPVVFSGRLRHKDTTYGVRLAEHLGVTAPLGHAALTGLDTLLAADLGDVNESAIVDVARGTARPAAGARGAEHPRVGLGTWPTPLEPAPRLAAALGLHAGDLWIKRDDLTGLGAGGNKVRKLEYHCGAALAAGATVLVTSGAAQSNHSRLTAAAAARLGVRAVLVLAGEAPAVAAGNLVLHTLLGAELRWAGAVDAAGLTASVTAAADELAAAGERPFVVPFGGSDARGALGYVACAAEVLAQLPSVRHVVTALGSGATEAGLVAHLGVERVVGVDVGAVPDPAAVVSRLVEELTGAAPSGLRVRLDQVGAGYPRLTPAVREALTLAARTEGIVLDPTYTGRALAGLAAAVRDGGIRPGEPVVLLHSGGLPGLFGHAEAVT